MRTITNPASNPAHYSYIEKKSEFIGDACHIDSLDEAVEFVEQIRAQHPKARHVCFAAVTGASQAQFNERMSDDGEPSGTAGKPILNVLRQSETTDTVIAVTRYFGGILLGAGSLVRAYSTAAAEALRVANLGNVIPAREFMCTVDYAQHSLIQRLIAQHSGRVHHEDFSDKVVLKFVIPTDRVLSMEQMVQQAFNASVQLIAGAESSLMEKE